MEPRRLTVTVAAAALQANPEAGLFFDSLAQFYRRAYLRWIDATKRRPEQRAERIAEMVKLLKRRGQATFLADYPKGLAAAAMATGQCFASADGALQRRFRAASGPSSRRSPILAG